MDGAIHKVGQSTKRGALLCGMRGNEQSERAGWKAEVAACVLAAAFAASPQ